MKKNWGELIRKLAVLLALTCPLSAAAYGGGGGGGGAGGVHVGLAGLIDNVQISGDNYSSGASKANRLFYDLKMGYQWPSVYFGAIYSAFSSDTGSTVTPVRTGYGVSLGYHNSGWFIDLNYFISAQIAPYNGNSSEALKPGSGYGLDVGYQAMVSGSFYIGAQITYDSFTFTKDDNGTVATASNNTQTELRPMFIAGFYF